MKEVSVKLEVDTREVTFKLRGLTFGQRNEAVRRSMKMTSLGNQAKADIDPSAYSEWRLTYSLVEPQEYFGSIEKVKSLPAEVADRLVEELDKISEVTPPTKPDSSGQQSPA